MHVDKTGSYQESCSIETISNAIDSFVEAGIIGTNKNIQTDIVEFSVMASEEKLRGLSDHIAMYLKNFLEKNTEILSLDSQHIAKL